MKIVLSSHISYSIPSYLLVHYSMCMKEANFISIRVPDLDLGLSASYSLDDAPPTPTPYTHAGFVKLDACKALATGTAVSLVLSPPAFLLL